MHSSRIVTEATLLPFTLTEAKLHLSVPSAYTDMDNRINELLRTVSVLARMVTGRAIGIVQVEDIWKGPPKSKELDLKYGKVTAITGVWAWDPTTLEWVNCGSDASPVNPNPIQWRETRGDFSTIEITPGSYTRFKVTYTVGTADASDVPKPIYEAMRMMLNDFYRNTSDALYFGSGQSKADHILKHFQRQ